MKGRVYLVGAGPGDPGLLTLRARETLMRADVVVYDALIDPAILEHAPPQAVRLFAGKHGRRQSGPFEEGSMATASRRQREINAALVRYARQGKQVVRLKGGDPLLFGRGAEEAVHLHANRIPFEIVPGVSSPGGMAAYAGIPLTDRHLSSVVTFITGHRSPDEIAPPVEWERIPRQGTLVVFMGLSTLAETTARLLGLGWKASTPAAAVQWASTSQQRTVQAPLKTLAAAVRKAALRSPALIVIGEVVKRRAAMQWFETRRLFGQTVVVTRPRAQTREFRLRLEREGAEVLPFPTIEIHPPASWKSLDAAIGRLEHFTWLVFTSINGVDGFFDRLRGLGRDVRDLKGLRVAAIGPKTAARLEKRGLSVQVFPSEYRAESLADALGDVRGHQVLLARALKARDVLPDTLRKRGAVVTIAVVYQTRRSRQVPNETKLRLKNGSVQVVTFTSSSTVHGFMAHFTKAERRQIFLRAKAAVIGPITAATLKEYGIRPAIRAAHYTTETLADAIAAYFK